MHNTSLMILCVLIICFPLELAAGCRKNDLLAIAPKVRAQANARPCRYITLYVDMILL